MSTLAYVAHHPDGTECTEYSYPNGAACPLIGTGVHKDMPYAPNETTDDEDILSVFIGPIDIKHLTETGQVRRILRRR